jgi:hypothetical protein
MWLFLIIYVSGYVAAYYSTKYMLIKKFGSENREWEDIIFALKISLCSWLTVGTLFIFVIEDLFEYISTKIKDHKSNNNPPKWM